MRRTATTIVTARARIDATPTRLCRQPSADRPPRPHPRRCRRLTVTALAVAISGSRMATLPDALPAIIDREMLREYVLSSDHEHGKRSPTASRSGQR